MDKQSAYNKKLDNALDYCIKLLSSGATIEECLRLYPNLRKELKELLLVVVSAKRAYPDYPELRPSKLYVKTGRDNFLTAIEGDIPAMERELFKPKATRSPAPFSLGELFRRYIAVGITIAMLFIALGGLLYASESSLPGSPLYGLKRAVESAELAMTFNNKDKDKLRREFLRRRKNEANLLAGLNALSAIRTEVLGYQISRDDAKGNAKNNTENNNDVLKLDGSIDKGGVVDSRKANPTTTRKKRSSGKVKKKGLAVAMTTTTNPPPAPITFTVGSISLSSDCISTDSTVTISVNGATSIPFDIELYKGSTKITVIAKQVSAGNYAFVWNGTDIDEKPVRDGEYKIKLSSHGQTASAEQNIIITSLPRIGLSLPADGATVKSSGLLFRWGDVADAGYSLRLVSMDNPNKSITVDNINNPCKPTANVLTMLLGDNNGIKKWNWRIVATTNDGKVAVSDLQTFSLDTAP